MADATVAEEEYLQSLFWLFEAGLPMTAANLSRAMQLSAPTVSEMVGAPRAGRLHLPQRRPLDRVHRVRPRAREADRRPGTVSSSGS